MISGDESAANIFRFGTARYSLAHHEHIVQAVSKVYLLTEWEGRTGKYLARGQEVRTERSEVHAS